MQRKSSAPVAVWQSHPTGVRREDVRGGVNGRGAGRAGGSGVLFPAASGQNLHARHLHQAQ